MHRFLSFICVAVATASCTHVYYAPATANVPLFSNKGETRLNGLYTAGATSEYNGAELQAAHAVGKNLGVMLNYFAASRSDDVSVGGNGSRVESGKGRYAEVALGYFRPLDLQRQWVFETYGGLGFGSVHNDYSRSDFSKTGITKFFLQPSIGYKGRHVEVALAPRLAVVSWKIKQERISDPGSVAAAEVAAVKADAGFFAFEPALLVRAGSQNLKLHLGLTLSNYNAVNTLVGDLSETTNASLGVSVSLGPKKKKAD